MSNMANPGNGGELYGKIRRIYVPTFYFICCERKRCDGRNALLSTFADSLFFEREYEGVYLSALSSRLIQIEPRNETDSFGCESQLEIYESRLRYTMPNSKDKCHVVAS